MNFIFKAGSSQNGNQENIFQENEKELYEKRYQICEDIKSFKFYGFSSNNLRRIGMECNSIMFQLKKLDESFRKVLTTSLI